MLDTDKVGLEPKKGSYKGLASAGEGSNVESHPSPQIIGHIDFNDMQQVQSVIRKYEPIIAKEAIENAIVMTTDGTVYRCYGKLNGIWPDVDLGDKLYGSIVTHNHPIGSDNEYSFSEADIKLFDRYKLKLMRGIDEKFIYELSRLHKEIDKPKVIDLSDEFFRHWQVAISAEDRKVGYRRWKRGQKA